MNINKNNIHDAVDIMFSTVMVITGTMVVVAAIQLIDLTVAVATIGIIIGSFVAVCSACIFLSAVRHWGQDEKL